MTKSISGVVYIEFLVSFVPVFLLFLGIVQLAFIATAKLVVQHAAIAGVRSAIVVMEDDHPDYHPTPFGVIDQNAMATKSSLLERNQQAIAKMFSSGKGDFLRSGLYHRGGPRINDIRSAVYFPLLAIAPSIEQISTWVPMAHQIQNRASTQDSLDNAIGSQPLLRLMVGLLYNKAATAVTFPERPGSTCFKQHGYGPTDRITVRVTHLFPCLVPMVSRFMCNSIIDLSGIAQSAKEVGRLIGTGASADLHHLKRVYQGLRRKTAFKPSQISKIAKEMSQAEAPFLLLPLMLSRARFVPLRAEATLQNQGANYYRK